MNRRQFIGSASTMGVALSLPPDILAADIPADLTELSASRLSAAIRQRHISCAEVMQAYLDRIARLNPVYNAIVSMADADSLLAEAARADEDLDAGRYRGWLHGMPFAIKDLADANGFVTTWGSRLYRDNVAETDSLHVARIRRAGAIVIGKTNAPEWGLGSQTYNEVFGATGNAYDPALTSGGSSGGAACGLASHMLPVADGSDMMGSLRNPAAFNNVIGFRPTQGRVPAAPRSDVYYHQLSTDGPMGRNVEDTVRLLGTIAGYDARAPLSLRSTLPGFDAYRPPSLDGFRLGWMADYDGYLATEEGVIDLCEAALANLAGSRVLVANCRPDYDLHRLWRTWLTLRHWDLGRDRELYDDPATRTLLKSELQWEIEGSFGLSANDISDAGIARTDWYRALSELFDSYDLLVLPSAQVFPFSKNTHWPKSIRGREMDTYHRWMEVVIGPTLAGLPAVSLPAGFDGRGRPMGMQFIGRAGEDRKVLEFALAYTAATDYLSVRPDNQPGRGA